jgi:Uma2 family endonuclease
VSLTITKITTADALLAMPDDGHRYELVKGDLIQMSPTGHEHGVIAISLSAPLHSHVRANKLGVVCAGETGFVLSHNPDTVRAADVAFIRQERYEKVGRTPQFWEGAPDLAVEVLSPTDTVRRVESKVEDWLTAGAQMVWVVSPRLRTVTIYRSVTEIAVLGEKDMVDGGEVIPGFRISVSEIFAE